MMSRKVPAASKSSSSTGHGSKATALADTLHKLRTEAELTLQELATRSGVAISTLSKIENGLMSPTYDTILRVATGLDIDVTDLFSGSTSSQHIVSGRRTVTRRGAGIVRSTGPYTHEMLAADLSGKIFIPLKSTIEAHSLSEFPSATAHQGEEFIYVLTGVITLHTDLYEPTTLSAGDSCYFDSTMGHACVSTGDAPAEILWICSQVIETLRT